MTSDPVFILLFVWFGISLSVGLIYALPGIIANYRHHSSETAIAALTLFAGWTIVGWVVATKRQLKEGLPMPFSLAPRRLTMLRKVNTSGFARCQAT